MTPLENLSLEQKLKVRDVYDRIASSPWFNANAVTQRELLILILEKLQSGSGHELFNDCETEARKRFSR